MCININQLTLNTLPKTWYQSPWWCVAGGQGIIKVSFAVGIGNSQLEQGQGACTWNLHKCTSHKVSPYRRSWKKARQKSIVNGTRSKKSDAV